MFVPTTTISFSEWKKKLDLSKDCKNESSTRKLESEDDLRNHLEFAFPYITSFGNDKIGEVVNKVMAKQTLTEEEVAVFNSFMPFEVCTRRIEWKQLLEGEEWNLSDEHGDATINLIVGKLTMPTGSHITCTDRSLNLHIDKLEKISTTYRNPNGSVGYDIGLFGGTGKNGNNGNTGEKGTQGEAGAAGKRRSPGVCYDGYGHPGNPGGPGGLGENGSIGYPGRELQEAIIYIYDFIEKITIMAVSGNGGNGGDGGKGGTGGEGGSGGKGCKSGGDARGGGDGGTGGRGGNGGNGGDGGNAGSGGTVEVYVPAGKENYVKRSTPLPLAGRGGAAGEGGTGGSGGSGGKAGHGAWSPGKQGSQGASGEVGKPGLAGLNGTPATIYVSSI